MLPATLVTLATFLLELANSSPVYNMQPAFVTTHIGSFTGRNIRNLPCISRKNPSQTGVCMFAIDCLKSNGTHLGTCIDRFYFGSCCHIEPHISDNTIDSEIIDVREPPVRLQNTTSSISTTSTSKPPSISSRTTTRRTTVITKKPITSTKKITTSSRKPIMSSKKPSTSTITHKSRTTTPSSSSNPQILSSITKKPVRMTTKRPSLGNTKPVRMTTKRPSLGNTNKVTTSEKTSINYSTESSTIPERLQTFQIIDGTMMETATNTPSHSTSKKPAPTKVPTKSTLSTSKPLIFSTATPVHAAANPSSQQLTSVKPTGKPIKTTKPTVGTKIASKPTKPAKVTLTTLQTSPSAGSTTSKPTKEQSEPTSKPVIVTSSTEMSTTSTSRPTTTAKVAISEEPGSTLPAKPPSEPTLTISSAPQNISSSQSSSITTSATKFPVMTENPLLNSNISQGQEASGGNVDTNEILYNAVPSTTTIKPSGLVTWTLKDNKTSFLGGNTGIVLTNITEEWIPLNPQDTTPQDEWVLLPAATHHTPSKNETTTVPPPVSHSSTTQIITIHTSESTTTSATSTASPISSTTAGTSSEKPVGNSDKPAIFTEQPPVQSGFQNDSFSFIWFTTIVSQDPIVTPSTEAQPLYSSVASTEKVNDTSIIPSSNITSITEGLGSNSSGISTEPMINNSTSAGDTTAEPEIKPVNMSDFTDVCGRRMFPGARIVGGEKSAYGRWPWQISLRQWRTSTYLHKCGAALLNENWAITAAHCVDNVPPNDLLLRLGEYDLSTDSEPYLHQERRVQIVASHPQFDPSTFEYDLALLRFYEPVTFQPNILPVCVPRNDENFVGKTAYVTGWGRLYEDGPLPSILQEVSVPVINNSVCESMYRSAGYIEHIPNIFICAGWRRGGFDSCEGDSGGPMVLQRDDKRFQLAGVISWGIGCAEPNQPGVYTRISEFRDWINQILQF